jgi:hypothetical protein
MTASIIYVTNRPGGYDMLAADLRNQTYQDFEVICVDELAPLRRDSVASLFSLHGLKLAYHGPSDVRPAKYGVARAINTGLLRARGDPVIVRMDFAWWPRILMEVSVRLRDSNPRWLVGFPETKVEVPISEIDIPNLADGRALTIFKTPVGASPSSLGWRSLGAIGVESELEVSRTSRWELYTASAPWSVYEELNGVDEELGMRGEDCPEVNISQRARLLGYDTVVANRLMIEQLWHPGFASDPLWDRGLIRGNSAVAFWYGELYPRIVRGDYPLRAPNNFDLGEARSRLLGAGET